MIVLKTFIIAVWAALFVTMLYSHSPKDAMDRVLLTGLAVAFIYSALQIILPLIGLDVDLSWLADGDVTLGEIVNFVGVILITISNRVRPVVKHAFGMGTDC